MHCSSVSCTGAALCLQVSSCSAIECDIVMFHAGVSPPAQGAPHAASSDAGDMVSLTCLGKQLIVTNVGYMSVVLAVCHVLCKFMGLKAFSDLSASGRCYVVGYLSYIQTNL